MIAPLPDIPESECTPLVRQLLDIVRHLQDHIQELEDEILRLKGLKTRPLIAPSPLEPPPRPPRDPGQKRPGFAGAHQRNPPKLRWVSLALTPQRPTGTISRRIV